VPIHHDLVVEKLEIARTIGLVTDYIVSPMSPAQGAQASIRVTRSATAKNEDVERYLAQLLDGYVPAQQIVVASPVTGDGAEPEKPPQQERVTPMGFALFPRTVHLHGLATVAAMLSCVAVVLNVGPFAKAPKPAALSEAVPDAVGLLVTAPMIGSSTESTVIPLPVADTPVPSRLSQAVWEREAASDPITTWTQPSPFPVAEATPVAFQPSGLKDGAGVVAQDDSADAAAQPGSDPATPEKPNIVGIWAPDAGTCSAREFRNGMLPTVINTEGAWAGDTFCMFTKRKETENGWSVVAKCSSPQQHWTSNVQLTVDDNRLRWTSKRGTQAYTRCAPDVLMAQAR